MKIKKRRVQRELDQVNIPADAVEVIEDEMLGMGGFGTVYLADFNGINAAAKVVYFRDASGSLPDDNNDDNDNGNGRRGDNDGVGRSEQDKYADGPEERQHQSLDDQKSKRRLAVALAKRASASARAEARQRLSFVRELEAMKRLRGSHTVTIYGAVTSMKGRLVLVMEFLPGGDLMQRLRKARRPLEKGVLRGIIRDVCSGMAFLHAEAFVHGDLKSANVLFDANGRAKVCILLSRYTNGTLWLIGHV